MLKEAAYNPKSSDKAGAIQLSDEHIPSLTSHLNPHSAKWRMIGTNLGFHTGELDVIQTNPALMTTAPMSYLNQLLTDWLQWAPGDGRGSKSFATLGALQTATRKAGLGKVAAQLTV